MRVIPRGVSSFMFVFGRLAMPLFRHGDLTRHFFYPIPLLGDVSFQKKKGMEKVFCQILLNFTYK